MSTRQDHPAPDRVSAFVAHLQRLAERDDRGALAALRRSLQEPSGVAMSACPHVVPFLPSEQDGYRERSFFLVAALFALHPVHAQGVSLGHAFRRIDGGAGNESTRARFVALLDAHPDDVADHLRHAVSLARAHDVPLDWVRTLKDLLAWRAPDRWAQRRLAHDFWHADGPAGDAANATTESEAVR